MKQHLKSYMNLIQDSGSTTKNSGDEYREISILRQIKLQTWEGMHIVQRFGVTTLYS